MFKLFKIVHVLGLTLFIGSVWVYILQGTPLHDPHVTQFIRHTYVTLIKTLTLPGLSLMFISGIGMSISRPALLRTTFFKIKLSTSLVLLINSSYLLRIAQRATQAAAELPHAATTLHTLLQHETLLGAVNVGLTLLLLSYSVLWRNRTRVGDSICP